MSDDECKIASLPLIPAEYTVNQVEITIRLRKAKTQILEAKLILE